MQKNRFKALMAACDSKGGRQGYCQAPFIQDGKMHGTDGAIMLSVDVETEAQGLLVADKAKQKAFLDTWPDGLEPSNGAGTWSHPDMSLKIDSEEYVPDVGPTVKDGKAGATAFRLGLSVSVLTRLLKILRALDCDAVTLHCPEPRPDEGDGNPAIKNAMVAHGDGWELLVMPRMPGR